MKIACEPKDCCVLGDGNSLDRVDQEIFKSLETENFEVVLRALKDAEAICNRLDHAETAYDIVSRYARVQAALAQAVKDVHIQPSALDIPRRSRIRECLLSYRYVFSTNYDLILYWAMQSEIDDEIKDYFWNGDGKFNLNDVEPNDSATLVHFLHGALHLYRLANGATYKKSNADGLPLLGQFGVFPPEHPNATPLVVTEGKSENKVESIGASEYLHFAYKRFLQYDGPLVVFGHSLGDGDQHLRDAIVSHPKQPLAISVRPGSNDKVIRTKVHYKERLHGRSEITFFNAETHPLGAPDLRVVAATSWTLNEPSQ